MESKDDNKDQARVPFLSKVDETIKAAAVSGLGVLALFHSFLKNMAPPVPDAESTQALVAFSAAVILMALSLLIRAKVRVIRQRVLAAMCLAFLAAAIAVFFAYRGRLEDVVYELPDQTKHVCGRFRASDIERPALSARGASVATNVSVADLPASNEACATRPGLGDEVMLRGGAVMVERNALLWDIQSQKANETMLLHWYLLLSLLLTASIYIGAIATAREWRARRPDPAAPVATP